MELGNVLYKAIGKSTKSIDLMDDFETRLTDGSKKYDTLFLRTVCTLSTKDQYCMISLFIQRRPYNMKCIESSLTFTKLKNHVLGGFFNEKDQSYNIVNVLLQEVAKLPKGEGEKEIDIFFKTPVEFHAQNSSNRCGYGTYYRGPHLIHEGTKYGETTRYMFVGARFHRW